MIETILQIVVYLFVEIIFEGIILRIFKGIKSIGLVLLKVVTFNKQSVKEIEESYKDSAKPYFIGFGVTIGIIYLTIKLIN